MQVKRHVCVHGERCTRLVAAFVDLAGTIITVRSLVRRTWTTHCWDGRLTRRP